MHLVESGGLREICRCVWDRVHAPLDGAAASDCLHHLPHLPHVVLHPSLDLPSMLLFRHTERDCEFLLYLLEFLVQKAHDVTGYPGQRQWGLL